MLKSKFGIKSWPNNIKQPMRGGKDEYFIYKKNHPYSNQVVNVFGHF